LAFVLGPDDDPAGALPSTSPRSAVLVDLDAASPPWIDLLGSDRRLGAVVVSPPLPSDRLRHLVALGCRSLLTTHDPLRSMGDALDALIVEEPFTSPSGLRLLFEVCGSAASGPSSVPTPSLSSREREVLWAMVDGSTIKATARALDVAVKTVEGHRHSIFTKLGVSSQNEAITRALSDVGILGRPTGAARAGGAR